MPAQNRVSEPKSDYNGSAAVPGRRGPELDQFTGGHPMI
jgi:hypothetical protein